MYNSNDINIEIVTISPAYAKTLLDANTANRKVSQRNLGRLKESLTNGEWKMNGEAIKIAEDGRVLDGQHRLHACVETGISISTVIMYGLEGSAQDTMDSGKSRTPADALTLRGYKNGTQLAAITIAVIRYGRAGVKAGLESSGTYAVTTPQVIARVESEPALVDLASLTYGFRRGGLTGRTSGLLYYIFSEIDPADADDFMTRLASGEGLERGNPILTLRNALIALKSERGQKNQVYVGAIAIKAWNKYRDGAQLMQLRYTPGGANPESFPEPK